MGISSGRLSEIVNAKRPLTEYYAEKICIALKLSEEDVRLIRNAMQSPVPSIKTTLPEEVLTQITDSKPFALLCFFQTDIYGHLARETPAQAEQLTQISARIQIPARELSEILNFMTALQIIEWRNGRWSTVHKDVIKAYDNPNSANIEGHLSDLSLTQKRIKNLSVYERDLSSLTLTMDPNQLGRARKMIREFRHTFAQRMDKGNPSGVFQINIQLFPLLVTDKESAE